MYVLGLGDYASPILGKRRSSFAEVPLQKFHSSVSCAVAQRFLSCAPLIFFCVNLINYVL